MLKAVKDKNMEDFDKIEGILRHIRNVQDNCELLAKKLFDRGETALAIKLIANGLKHDSSKMTGIEFEYLNSKNKNKQALAIHQHNTTNLHHPEAWDGGIHTMPKLYLLEMCCDLKARSQEFGTNVREWVDEVATVKYNFSKKDDVYGDIMEFLDMLCDKPFSHTKEKD